MLFIVGFYEVNPKKIGVIMTYFKSDFLNLFKSNNYLLMLDF